MNTDFSEPKLTVPVSKKDHHFGPLDAPIVIVEYADMECPHCKDVQPILVDLMERMGDRICLVFRHFPIQNQHSHAQKAAEAVEAAAAQGKFGPMVRALFRQQDKLEFADLLKHAEAVGLDVDRFQRELEEGKYADRVREDFKSGVRSGVNGTPTFFINGTRYDGAWDLESLLEVIEKPLGIRVTRLAQEFTRRAASGDGEACHRAGRARPRRDGVSGQGTDMAGRRVDLGHVDLPQRVEPHHPYAADGQHAQAVGRPTHCLGRQRRPVVQQDRAWSVRPRRAVGEDHAANMVRADQDGMA